MPWSKEQKAIYMKEYREKNRDKLRKKGKEYQESHKDEIKEYYEEYLQTPQGKKKRTISDWKTKKGLVCEDYDSLYCHYLNAENCDNCNVTFGVKGDGSWSWKCMDHDHSSGLFRNFLCNRCNILRGP